MTEKLKEALPEMWKASPPWFAMILVVCIFIYYQDRQANRVLESQKAMQAVSDLRIQAFQDVQEQSTEAMKTLSTTLQKQSESFARLQVVIERME